MNEKTPLERCFENLLIYLNYIQILHKVNPTKETQEIVNMLRKWRERKDVVRNKA